MSILTAGMSLQDDQSCSIDPCCQAIMTKGDGDVAEVVDHVGDTEQHFSVDSSKCLRNSTGAQKDPQSLHLLQGLRSILSSDNRQSDKDTSTDKGLLVHRKTLGGLHVTHSLKPRENDALKANTSFISLVMAPSLPTFEMRDYGVAWYKDNVRLITNAIRREMKDLYVIITSMQTRRDSLQPGDVTSFYKWFAVFEGFFRCVFVLLTDTVVPWIERAESLPDDEYCEREGGRMKVGIDLSRTLRKVVKHELDFVKMEPVVAFDKLLKVFQKWSLKALAYMSSLEVDSARIIENNFSIEECRNMEKWIAAEVMKSPDRQANIVLLVRFLDDRPQSLTAWKNANLDALTRTYHAIWWKRLAADHFEVVGYFRRSNTFACGLSKDGQLQSGQI
jgi:hypothetical protein